MAVDSSFAQSRPASAGVLPGFTTSEYRGEQIKEYRIEPGVQIHVNAPSAEQFDPRRPTRLIFFALPNGNTTAQTIGKKMTPGLDWHYDIQHIGAQTRKLREVLSCPVGAGTSSTASTAGAGIPLPAGAGIPSGTQPAEAGILSRTSENIVVVYLEADGKSWPSWRSKHADLYGKLNWQVIESVRELFRVEPASSRSAEPPKIAIELTGHSGGGSFVFGCINGVEKIPADVRRISFLDSNYNYTDADHGDKLVAWLKSGDDHCLSVICYDDRNVKFEGKPIVSATGGTYRRSSEMVERLKRDFAMSDVSKGDLLHYRGLNGRIDIILHKNPENKILHTVLVGPMNGFIHAMTVGTPYEDKAAIFAGPPAYEPYIQP